MKTCFEIDIDNTGNSDLGTGLSIVLRKNSINVTEIERYYFTLVNNDIVYEKYKIYFRDYAKSLKNLGTIWIWITAR